MTRIAIGGFLHETNTFAPTKATYADFVHGGGWPAMVRGADVLTTIRNINVGLAGFIADAGSAAAQPSASRPAACRAKKRRPLWPPLHTLSRVVP